MMRAKILAVAVLSAAAACGAQTAKPAVIEFRFEHAQLTPAKYEITVQQDGTLTYSELGAPAQQMEVPIATAVKIFGLATDAGYFKSGCESAVKHVAFMGTKTLRYAGGAGEFKCVYNLPVGEEVNSLTKIFQGMASTIAHGDRLMHLRRFDRLGLDAEINSLDAELKSGSACEVELIAGTLKAIAQDADVMRRVRLKAGKMLESIKDPHFS